MPGCLLPASDGVRTRNVWRRSAELLNEWTSRTARPEAVVSRQSKQMLTVLVEAGVALLAAIAMTLAFAGELVSEQASHRSRADLVPQPVVQR